jgi:hypothetical protein
MSDETMTVRKLLENSYDADVLRVIIGLIAHRGAGCDRGAGCRVGKGQGRKGDPRRI